MYGEDANRRAVTQIQGPRLAARAWRGRWHVEKAGEPEGRDSMSQLAEDALRRETHIHHPARRPERPICAKHPPAKALCMMEIGMKLYAKVGGVSRRRWPGPWRASYT